MKPTHNAKLVSGRRYCLLVPSGALYDFIVFERGVAVPVSRDVKRHLELYAVDPRQTTFSTGDVEVDYVSKFDFEELDQSPEI